MAGKGRIQKSNRWNSFPRHTRAPHASRLEHKCCERLQHLSCEGLYNLFLQHSSSQFFVFGRQPFFLSPPWHPVPPTPFIYISPYFIRNNKSEALGLSALIINTSIQTDSCREGKICLSVVRDYGCVRKNEAHPQSFCLRNQPDSMIDYKLPQIKGYRDTAIPSFFFCLL